VVERGGFVIGRQSFASIDQPGCLTCGPGCHAHPPDPVFATETDVEFERHRAVVLAAMLREVALAGLTEAREEARVAELDLVAAHERVEETTLTLVAWTERCERACRLVAEARDAT
jgi:hypothetical protein